ncbi:related to SIK1 - involved in pre-rRNA processing [Cephalotrichum gorgonifer]|uniref:Nucleolar protein 56 n=1 Tax=Cephalotrichum gorgonifer TaxID=2041049 RepID=A0AAE8MT56_9PEZI|nr:related to SIK1 - involved in pre-rRNA processing [Cephalotrichum gorgonifer]
MAARIDYILYDSSLGYSVFQVSHQVDGVALNTTDYQKAVSSLDTFGKTVKAVGFSPFRGYADAFDNANKIAEGVLSDALEACIAANLPETSGKKSKITLGVYDSATARVLKERFPGYQYESRETSAAVDTILRGIRLYNDKILSEVKADDLNAACRALAHAYSRGQVKFNTSRDDVHIIQRSAVLESIDKGLNQWTMRLREWYGSHFPELSSIVSDNYTYAKLAKVIGDKATLNQDRLHEIAAVLDDDEEKAQAVIDAAETSMGPEYNEYDMQQIMDLATLTADTFDRRRTTATQLDDKLGLVAPNLRELLGAPVSARLIAQAGSLVTLAKYPASTLQILGAEKALFRALKTKGNTPKYGILYHSSAIGKASTKNKGRISRYLANKCSIASRIDAFSGVPNSLYGKALKQQVDDRLEFYATGKKTAKNADVMSATTSAMQAILGDADEMDVDAPAAADDDKAARKAAKKAEKAAKKAKKEAKDKKRAREEEDAAEEDGEKKKKKKSKKSKTEA